MAISVICKCKFVTEIPVSSNNDHQQLDCQFPLLCATHDAFEAASVESAPGSSSVAICNPTGVWKGGGSELCLFQVCFTLYTGCLVAYCLN